MKKLFLLIVCQLTIFCHAQNLKYKNVSIIESFNENTVTPNDSTLYPIYRFDTVEFKQLLKSHDKVMIQLWQPWCGGVKYWMERLSKLQEYCIQNGIQFYLISDSEYEEGYLVNNEEHVGILTKYMNDYHIRFKNYIISKETHLKGYQKIIETHFFTKLKPDALIFLIENGKLVYRNNSFNSYQHFLGK